MTISCRGGHRSVGLDDILNGAPRIPGVDLPPSAADNPCCERVICSTASPISHAATNAAGLLTHCKLRSASRLRYSRQQVKRPGNLPDA